MTKPLIGTGNGDEVREMTDEEYADYEATVAEYQPLPSPE
jgi:hypothetical protein